MTHALIVIGVLGPLAIDTFAAGAALGIIGLQPRERLRTSVVLSAFEGGMPIVGFLVGDVLGGMVGRFADYAAIAFLAFAGALLLRPGHEDAEERRLKLLARTRGAAVIYLGLAVSVDELAIGFSLGFLGISLLVAVIWIGVQALISAQLGMRLGSRVGEELRERAEQLAGVVLVAMAAVLMVLKVSAGL